MAKGRMSLAGPPNRGNDPLNIWMMAVALVAAAFFGAALGFVIDFSIGEEEQKAAPTQQD
ncbi:MAG TPA: hypothetical protein VLA37_03145 [Sphingomonadaceae bacterium]|nr:hypothetical protein [Sphingomonadaceae bacterium]